MAYTVIERGKPVGAFIRQGKAIARAADKAPILERHEYNALIPKMRPADAIIIEPLNPGRDNGGIEHAVDSLAKAMCAEMNCDPVRSVTCFRRDIMTDLEREKCRNQKLIAATTVADFWQTLRPAAARFLAAQTAWDRLQSKL